MLFHLLENQLIFWPDRRVARTPAAVSLPFEELTIEPVAGTRIFGWLVPHPAARAIVLYLMGNGGNRSQRLNHVRLLHDLGCAVMIVDYEGYGSSEGRPSELNVYRDSRVMLDWIAGDSRVCSLPLVLHGESLGGAVAIRMASERPPAGMIVDHSFTTMGEMIDIVCRGLPLRQICRSEFNSMETIRQYHGPLLIIHGEEDRLIPVAQGRRLFEAANEPKLFLAIPRAGHHHDEVLRLGGEPYRQALHQLIEQAVAGFRNSLPE